MSVEPGQSPACSCRECGRRSGAIEVRIAGMVDQLRAAAAGRAVDAPVGVEVEQVVQRASGAPIRLPAADPMPGVLDHLAPRGNRRPGEDTHAMDGRRAHLEREAGMSGVDRSSQPQTIVIERRAAFTDAIGFLLGRRASVRRPIFRNRLA